MSPFALDDGGRESVEVQTAKPPAGTRRANEADGPLAPSTTLCTAALRKADRIARLADPNNGRRR